MILEKQKVQLENNGNKNYLFVLSFVTVVNILSL